ncbi:hypothetical protein Syn7502_00496 [Synechococcus sp. PCC 7502]|uniref:UPF0182 family protein n=1 Tax=Synechococcus sp. PCC 7502 TaxID=1173263 RepID=UPI00029FCA9B|nr:UPF0182 family protein [Synechococcus sp. PCC 7502]AFY72655.1 hypothetical protein Syn7502_00496 [Synechococcus sp. PCC 7502]
MKLNSSNLTTLDRPKHYYLWLWVGIVAVVLTSEIVARLGGEMLWFQEVGYLYMYWRRLAIQIGLGGTVLAIALVYLFRNLQIAQKLKYADLPSDSSQRAQLKYQIKAQFRPNDPQSLALRTQVRNQVSAAFKYVPTSLRLRWLLPLVLGLSFLICLLVIHYGQVAIAPITQWQTTLNQSSIAPPALFRPELISQLIQTLTETRLAVLTFGVAIAMLVYPQFLLRAIAVLISVFTAWVISRQWMRIIPYFQPTSFERTEPVFNQDLSFYIFNLPTLEILEFGLVGICLYGFIAVFLTYLLSGNSLSEGKFIGISHNQQRHLYGLGGVLMLVVSFSYWLNRYELLYSPRGVSYGASYTDIVVQLPVYTGLSILALAIAGYLILRWLKFHRQPVSRKPIFASIAIYLLMAIGLGVGLPSTVQSLIVQPNELAREQPYIKRTIAFTREAFGLESIDTQVFNPQGKLTEQLIQKNDLTVRNIRLWDKQPLLATNRQLQQIRLYYSFPDADIDRYTITEENLATTPNSQQQVLIAARELDYAVVPLEAQTWVNQHLIYTHGYGFTLSPVNRVGAGGLPEYFIKDIGATAGSPLTTSSKGIRNSIPIGQPRIYYGENTNTYVMTGTKVKELDYPSDNDNVYNIYDGRGGISLNSFWRRILFSKYLNDWRMAVTPEFLPDTKLMFRRNIRQRIKAIAPFLRYDSDPYLVAADAKSQPDDPNSLYWIVDAYTTSDRYPYSDIANEGINYIRDSVKVVIDAYHGTVNFYIAEPRDPMIRTWAKIFPELFKPLSAMPEALRQHLRYPVDLFSIQSERLMTYHMTDPQVFYNREDQWQIPNEVYGDKPRPVEPYYLITSLPSVPFEEFILLLPFTPKQRTNLVAWLAARSDGENYGKLLLYTFPKQILVYGTEQIEARINQDPIISQQISLWNRQGSRVIQGNLLIIPIEQSLLYVEPIYLESTQNKLPTLVRVVVAYENQIVMAQTLPQAIAAIFKPEAEVTSPIVRPVNSP